MPYRQFFFGRLNTMPPLLFWETPYRCVVKTIWIAMHASALSREVCVCVDFQLRMYQNRLSAGLYQTRWKSLHCSPNSKLDLGEGTRDREGTQMKERKGRRERKEWKRKDGRERGKVPCRHLFFPVPALIISELVASVYYCESCGFCVLFFYVNLSFG